MHRRASATSRSRQTSHPSCSKSRRRNQLPEAEAAEIPESADVEALPVDDDVSEVVTTAVFWGRVVADDDGLPVSGRSRGAGTRWPSPAHWC